MLGGPLNVVCLDARAHILMAENSGSVRDPVAVAGPGAANSNCFRIVICLAHQPSAQLYAGYKLKYRIHILCI